MAINSTFEELSHIYLEDLDLTLSFFKLDNIQMGQSKIQLIPLFVINIISMVTKTRKT